jgi:predicted glycogen debranching enzyme
MEASRGQVASGSAFSPGWFDLPMDQDAPVTMVFTADLSEPAPEALRSFAEQRQAANQTVLQRAGLPAEDVLGRRLALAAEAYVVRRDSGKTVIAGYPWFLDWGRDSLICARGLLAAGREEEVKDLLVVFGRFEDRGTLPNIIHGEDASNRDTTDAPLWYGIVCEELAARPGTNIYATPVDESGRTLGDVLRAIALGYRNGTPNGIRMDGASALIWSPSHFTWMDTNFPAATPREGYPVEIQVLWVRLLRQLARLGAKAEGESWEELASRAERSFHQLFWLGEKGWLADVLTARPNQTAAEAAPDTALRSNGLFAVSLGLVTGERAQRCVQAALKYLVVPGALRSLSPLLVKACDGGLLDHSTGPYFGRYEGDEDTRRKPAYHNGTAWTWTYPVFCEALARAWDFSPTSVTAARAHLGSLDRLLIEGCVGQVPEVIDGDAPHQERGCDAQAWGVTEAFRVWKLLNATGK